MIDVGIAMSLVGKSSITSINMVHHHQATDSIMIQLITFEVAGLLGLAEV